MIGCTTFGWMECMCRCGLKGGINSSVSWGGLTVVVFLGDDVQFPPVCDCPVYNNKSKYPAAIHGELVWKEFDTSITLSTFVRQDAIILLL